MKKIVLFVLILAISACKTENKKNNETSTIEIPKTKAPKSKGNKRILFVGNSHTEYYVSLPELFKALCVENKKDFEVETLIEMGVSLDEIYETKIEDLTKMVLKKDDDGNYFDYVVLQEKTPIAIDESDVYMADVKKFTDAIHKNSPGTVVLIYEAITPFDYKNERADFEDFFLLIKSNVLDVVKEIPNSKLLKIGSAIKEAYEGKNNYVAYRGNDDLLRHGEQNLHMLNDAGFMASVLLFETVFDSVPQIPISLPLCTGVDEDDTISLQEVNKVISNKTALMEIAYHNK